MKNIILSVLHVHWCTWQAVNEDIGWQEEDYRLQNSLPFHEPSSSRSPPGMQTWKCNVETQSIRSWVQTTVYNQEYNISDILA